MQLSYEINELDEKERDTRLKESPECFSSTSRTSQAASAQMDRMLSEKDNEIQEQSCLIKELRYQVLEQEELISAAKEEVAASYEHKHQVAVRLEEELDELQEQVTQLKAAVHTNAVVPLPLSSKSHQTLLLEAEQQLNSLIQASDAATLKLKAGALIGQPELVLDFLGSGDFLD